MTSKNKKLFISLILLPGIFGLITVFAASAFDPDSQPVGYVGQPAVSSNIVASGLERLFAIDYSSQNWSGDLHSYSLSKTGAISTIDDWDNGAAAEIDSQNFDTGRKIVTWNGSAGIPFRWASLSTGTGSQQTVLGSESVLNYIRGDTSNQTPNGLKYRSRTNVLGDIIHSTPVYWNDGTNKTVFVGANDGMLHAIDAEFGKERFAYIPSVLIPKLSALTNISYSHKYYVDGRLDIHQFSSKTILAGALGAGGKGLFALDVTVAAATTESDAASKVLWEITNTGIKSKDSATHNPTSTAYANLGYTYSAPTQLILPDGTEALAVGNGYNNSGNGHASLFLINANTGALIQEIDTGSGSTTSPNGLSSPSFIDTNGDGKPDYAYAGDIDGNLWKFSLAKPYSSTVARSATLLHTTNPAQAITMAPGIKTHPLGGVMLTFVTGKMLIDADKTNNATHYAYGIWDGAPAANDTLFSQTLTETTYSSVSPSIRVRTVSSTVANTVPDWTDGAGHHKGWKTALPIGGERVVGDGAMVTNSIFLFMTTNPVISPTAKPPGENWWMQLNALTGGDSNTVLFDLNKDGKYNSADQVSAVSSSVSLNPVGRNMGGGVRSQLIALSATGFDVYQSNYDRNGSPPPVTTTTTTNDRGVSGGHFDFDIHCYTITSCGSSQHTHEYDDKYDVTGVDMLNPSQVDFKLTSGRVGTKSFKILVANQAYSPAAKISIGGNNYVDVYGYQSSADLKVASIPAYTFSTVSTLKFNLPLDAFKSKDWGTGIVRAGLQPTQTGCVKGTGTNGTSGEWRNGALTIQIVNSTVVDSDVQLNVAGRPELGYRLKSPSTSTKLIAEYTVFWHHPNGKCMETGWTMSPPEDTSAPSKKTATPAAGSTDPKDGIFVVGGASGSGSPSPGTVTSSVTNLDGSVTTTTSVTVTNTDGTKTTTTTITTTGTTSGIETGGVVNTSGDINADGTDTRAQTSAVGRINWRELQQ